MKSLFFAVCFLVVWAAGSFGERVELVREGKILFHAVPDENQDPLNQEVLADLSDLIQRLTSHAVPQTPQPNSIPLFIGEPEDFSALSIQVPDLEHEESFLKVTPEAIYVLGGSSLGTQHGVYTLLRDLGFRFVLPGELGECFPQSEGLSLQIGERIESPDFRMRMINCYGQARSAEENRLWLKRNRCYRPSLNDGHNLTRTLERLATYEDRPDLYALIQGERKRTQVCTSNSEAVELITQSANDYLDQHPDLECYSLCPDDNWDFCECENCRALDSGHMDRGGLPSISDRYQIFLNQVLAGIEERHPNTLISTYAYNPNHTDPPQQTPVHPNTAVFATTNNFCSAHGAGNPHCDSRNDFTSLLKEWRALTEHLYIFEYDPEPYCGGLPWPMRKAHSTSIPIYRDIGVKGMTVLGQNSWAAYFPSYYVAAQLLWDSASDPEEVYQDMLDRFFGEAAEPMRAHYDALESSFLTFEERAVWGMEDYPEYFSADSVREAKKALERAKAIPVSEAVRTRIEMSDQSFQMFESYLSIRQTEHVSYAEFKKEADRFQGAIDRLVEMSPNLLNADYAREKTGIALSERFAREQGFVNDWLLCGPFDNLGMDGHDRIYPPEQEIDLNESYEGKGGEVVSWRRNRTPTEQAYIDLREEYDQNEWVCAYALGWVTVQGDVPKEVVLRLGSNDTSKVFLNGEKIWDQKGARVCSVDDDLIPVTLLPGESTILLKIGQAGLNWGFYFRITEPDSREVPPGVKVTPTPPER